MRFCVHEAQQGTEGDYGHGRREGVESSSFKRLGSEGEKKTREQPEGQVRSPGGFVYVCF